MKSSKNFPRNRVVLVIQITLGTRLSERLNIGTKLKKCKIWLTKKKIFWERNANLETRQKRFSHVGVTYKLVLESVKSLR